MQDKRTAWAIHPVPVEPLIFERRWDIWLRISGCPRGVFFESRRD